MVPRSGLRRVYSPGMIRFLVNTAVYMAAAAIGLVVADIVVDGLGITYPVGFLVAAVLFGLIQAIITPFFDKVARENASVLVGGVGLFSALISLYLTAALTDGLTIDGFGTGFLAALVIWLASMAAGFILKVTIAKRFIQEVRD